MPTVLPSGAPGVYISETLIGPTPGPLANGPSACCFVGEHWRGPNTAVMCVGWNQFVQYFGGFNTSATPTLANPYLAYAVYEFFANGGQIAWVVRVGATATPGVTASLILKDQAATPQNTLTLTAGLLGVSGNIGTWGNALSVDVIANTSGAGRFNLNIYLNSVLVEQWIDLSMTTTDARYVVAILNSASQGSLYVVATNDNSGTAAPNNAPASIVHPAGGSAFTGGVDASDPSAADRIAAVTSGTSAMDYIPGVLNFNMPGETTASVINAALLYAAARPYTFCVIDTPSGQTPAGAVSYFATLTPPSVNGAVYYPWVNAPNPASSNLQSTILLPPGGYVLGQFVATDANAGVWVAPAGDGTVLSNCIGVERRFSPADLNTLNNSNVNALKTRPNGQVVIWGTRTMLQGYATLFVPVRRTLNYIESSLAALLEPSVFQPNDSLLWGNITKICNQFLDGLFVSGAFPGNTSATSYYVTCDATNNTAQSIAAGVVNTTVGVALLIPAEFIQLTIAQFTSNGTVVVTSA